MLNPLNSWGWPLEIKDYISENNLNLNKFTYYDFFDRKILISSLLKISLFFYRIIFFSFYFYGIINIFKRYKLSIFKVNRLDLFLPLISFFYLLSIFYLFIIKYPALEHRYISMAIPWLEISSCVFFDRWKNFFLKNKSPFVSID